MVFNFLKKKSTPTPQATNTIKPLVLLVLDGWGIAPPSKGNAITLAKTPTMDKLQSSYPHGQLIAAGEAVGLPANEAGNSEVGHLTLGTGRVTLQSLPRINKAISDESFFDNDAFLQAADHVKKFGSKLHLLGLFGTGEVHSSYKHVQALLKFCRQQQLSQVFIHVFTDGRDSPPKQGLTVIQKLEKLLADLAVGKIATISGRYYAMDRDKRWQRTEKTYKAMVLGQGQTATSAVEAIKTSYAANKTDEFIEPTVIVKPQDSSSPLPESGQINNKTPAPSNHPAIQPAGHSYTPIATIDDNDAAIFFNFRIDRPRQLTMAFVMENFEKLTGFEFEADPHKIEYAKKHGQEEVYSGTTFSREKWPQNLFFVTMTEYQRNVKVSAVAFPTTKVHHTLAEVLAKNGLKQLRLAESEKERMVTYYFDGLREECFIGEDVLIVPSPKVATYDKKPEMSVFQIIEEFKKALQANIYQFIMINFANPDMVAHSGNLKAAIKACQITDQAIGEIIQAVSAYNGSVIITADHGNAEDLLTFPDTGFFYTTAKGVINTEHSNNPIPIIFVFPEFAGKSIQTPQGTMSDVAPTILKYLNLDIPQAMTGKNLLESLTAPQAQPK